MTEEAPEQNLAWASEQYALHRRRLFGIAYRMMGSVADADDILQDVWVRWQTARGPDIVEPAAFLATITTRLSINALQSARVRRETYIGPWLPEPVNTQDDPTLGAERAEALQYAVLILLERLTPTERAAYVLREAFDYPYEQIADIVGGSVVGARKLVSRARRHLASERRVAVAAGEQRRLLVAFLAAAQEGDTAVLEQLFAADVVSYTDGNGVKLAARIPVRGSARVAQFVAAFSRHFWTGKTIAWVELNGEPAIALIEDAVVTTAFTVSVDVDGIHQVLWIMSPEKLGRVSFAS